MNSPNLYLHDTIFPMSGGWKLPPRHLPHRAPGSPQRPPGYSESRLAPVLEGLSPSTSTARVISQWNTRKKLCTHREVLFFAKAAERAVENKVYRLRQRRGLEAPQVNIVNVLNADADPATCTKQQGHVTIPTNGTPLVARRMSNGQACGKEASSRSCSHPRRRTEACSAGRRKQDHLSRSPAVSPKSPQRPALQQGSISFCRKHGRRPAPGGLCCVKPYDFAQRFPLTNWQKFRGYCRKLFAHRRCHQRHRGCSGDVTLFRHAGEKGKG